MKPLRYGPAGQEKPGMLDASGSMWGHLLDDQPTVIDVVVTRDPAQMLPAADSRTLVVKAGDRPV